MKENRSFDDILNFVSDYTNISREEITGAGRESRLVDARIYIYHLCFKYTDMGYTKIGTLTGGRSHATVLNAIKKMRDLADVDYIFKCKLDTLDLFFKGSCDELKRVTDDFLKKTLYGSFEKNDYYYSKLKFVASVLNQEIRKHEDKTRR